MNERARILICLPLGDIIPSHMPIFNLRSNSCICSLMSRYLTVSSGFTRRLHSPFFIYRTKCKYSNLGCMLRAACVLIQTCWNRLWTPATISIGSNADANYIDKKYTFQHFVKPLVIALLVVIMQICWVEILDWKLRFTVVLFCHGWTSYFERYRGVNRNMFTHAKHFNSRGIWI